MNLFEKLRRLFLPVQPTHKCDVESQGKLYETSCLSPRTENCFGVFGTPEEMVFCINQFRRYFDVTPTDTFKLVVYSQPSKYRYSITIAGNNVADAYITIDGKRCRNVLFVGFQRLLYRACHQLGDRKLYVECEIQ